MKKWVVPAVVIAGGLFVTLVGLAGIGGSGPYKPHSEREAAALKAARRDVFPDDVRSAPAAFAETLVAWAGVVRSVEYRSEGDALIIYFEVEHRFFDWLQNFGATRRLIDLSSTGEGRFRCAWSVPLAQRLEIESQVHEGDLVIVYGNPEEIRDGVIGMYPTEYVRLLPAAAFTDEFGPYGRSRARR